MLAHEILNGRPYTFLDDAPLEERRTRSVQLRRGVPIQSHRPRPSSTRRRRAGALPRRARSCGTPEELHDLLGALVLVEPEAQWEPFFQRLVTDGRACEAILPPADRDDPDVPAPGERPARWAAMERCRDIEALLPGTTFRPAGGGTAGVAPTPAAGEEALVVAVFAATSR